MKKENEMSDVKPFCGLDILFFYLNFDTYSVIAVKPCNGMMPQIIPIMMPNTCRDQ